MSKKQNIPVISNLEELIEAPTKQIGSVIAMDYTQAIVATEDSSVMQTNGVPRNSFLIAVAKDQNGEISEIILLSVKGKASLNFSQDLQNVRENLAIQHSSIQDPRVLSDLGVVGLECKIIGTFFRNHLGKISFGADVDRIRGNSIFSLYKPQGRALSLISSYGVQGDYSALDIGVTRYSDTLPVVDTEARVYVNVDDFIGKKTAILGMTRAGKSNSIKIITEKVFTYTRQPGRKPLGQLIFDPQGEYANTNSQDGEAIANLGDASEVRIYKTMSGKDFGNEKIDHLQFNLFDYRNVKLLWQLMLKELYSGISGSSNYISGLESVRWFTPKNNSSPEEKESYKRKLFGLWALMGYALSDVYALKQPLKITVGNSATDIATFFEELEEVEPGVIEVHTTEAARLLFEWMLLNQNNLPRDFARAFDRGVLTIFKEQVEALKEGKNGVMAAFRKVLRLHNDKARGDVREKIWQDLKMGKLVIVDLSRGNSKTTTNLSELILEHLLSESSNRFVNGDEPVPFQIIVEEAHNLFRREGQQDSNDPWVRISKEASKYKIGLVYATQEVTGVDPQILSNTSNWLIAHLNSKVETGALGNYYSFKDWEEHLRAVETRGFVRMKTYSSPYIIPVQIDKFELGAKTISSSQKIEPEENDEYSEIDAEFF